MKRPFFLQILLALLVLATVEAKWMHLSKLDLIPAADVIAVADYHGFEKVDLGQTHLNQKGAFTLVRVIKGELPEKFSVLGSDMEICTPLYRFANFKQGRYLVFLHKNGEALTGCNEFFEIIEDNKVSWFDDKNDLSKSPQHLDAVVAEIHAILSRKEK